MMKNEKYESPDIQVISMEADESLMTGEEGADMLGVMFSAGLM